MTCGGTIYQGVFRNPLAEPYLLGSAGGAALGATVALLVPFFALYHQHFLTVGESIALGVVIAIAAPLGDLFESALKRDMNVKDTGRLLAGHGGMLDRIDALLFAAPAAYFAVLAFQ